MSKSQGNFTRLDDIIARGIDPLAFRYWLLTAHYTTAIQFSFEALEAAQVAYKKLIRSVALLSHKHGRVQEKYKKEFTEIINNDLDTPGAIAFVWKCLKETEVPSQDIRATIELFDHVLGLSIGARVQALVEKIHNVPAHIRELAHKRDAARTASDWATADQLRTRIAESGFILEDGPDGSILMPAEAF